LGGSLVQGRADPQREILDVESVEAMFADLFRAGGRPSIPAEVMASVIVLQTLHGLSDKRSGRGGDVRSAVEGRVWAGGH
jgi:hypothetical protein